jgi:glycosyltransferase involved in cell wall biosynthesis
VKVILTVDSLESLHGGPSRSVPALVRALVAEGVDAELWCLRGDSQYSDIQVREFASTKELVSALKQLMGQDVVLHDNGIWLYFNWQVCQAAAEVGIPYVISPRGMLEPWSLHQGRWKKKLAWKSYQHRLLANASLLHATSVMEAGGFRRAGLRAPITVQPNGVELPPERAKGGEEKRTVVYLSRLHTKKGLDMLLQAWSELALQGWKLNLVGGGELDYVEGLKRKARLLGLEESVVFSGEAKDAAKWDHLRQADFFVLPSFSENFGIVVAEALAAGLPVITTTGTPWTQLDQKSCGMCIPPEKEALKAAILHYAKMSSAERERQGSFGRAWVQADFSWGAAARGLRLEYDRLSHKAAPPYDLCIAGAGPAGILCALEYAKRCPHHRIALVDCGPAADGQHALDQAIVNHNPQNHHEPRECTNKGLGGSSISWGGRCVMYDPIDFLPHGPVQEACTWSPKFLEDVRPYLDETAAYFKAGQARFRLAELPSSGQPIAEGFTAGELEDTVLERWSLPTRFGRHYREAVLAHPQITWIPHFAAAGLELKHNTGEVNSLNAQDGRSVAARRFVLACGGQETTRLLLANPQIFPTSPPSLGKYYQGHVSGKIAQIKFHGDPTKTQYGFEMDGAVYCRRRFQFTAEALQRHGVLNTAFWLDTPPFYIPSHGSGVLSLIYLAVRTPGLGKRLLPAAIARSVTANDTTGVAPHIKNVLKGLPGSLLTPAAIFWKRYLRRRSLPGVYLPSQSNRYALHFHAEQVPVEENRMELAKDGKLHIHYGYTDADVDSVIRSHELLDAELRRQGCGELEWLYPREELPERIRKISMDGLHQVGTTRIGKDVQQGVVDENLKLHGVDNLFVCSSSVFPTSGQANPTFFLGACAIRLAAHLAAAEPHF